MESDSKQRNVLQEYQWKRNTTEKGRKAYVLWRKELGRKFPALDVLNDEVCAPGTMDYFIPNSNIGLKVKHGLGCGAIVCLTKN